MDRQIGIYESGNRLYFSDESSVRSAFFIGLVESRAAAKRERKLHAAS